MLCFIQFEVLKVSKNIRKLREISISDKYENQTIYVYILYMKQDKPSSAMGRGDKVRHSVHLSHTSNYYNIQFKICDEKLKNYLSVIYKCLNEISQLLKRKF